MNLAEQYRGLVLRRIFAVPAFVADWPKREAFINSVLGARSGWTAPAVVELGSRMRELFALGAPPKGTGRSQSGLSAAGTVWECLVTYYLNLCYAGTDTVAIRTSEVPSAVGDALTVWQGATPLAADVDSMVLHLPGLSNEPAARSGAALERDIERLFSTGFRDTTVVVLACKTTWADSIQTPMLWNLLYGLRRANVPIPGSFSIGKGTYSLDTLRGFAYAFLTVPSQDPTRFKQDGSPVLRARTMSGGHFWGRPTVKNIAPSFTEFFGRQAGIVRIAGPGDVGIALADEGRTGAGNIDLAEFHLV